MRKTYLFSLLFTTILAFCQESGELDTNFGASGFLITNDLEYGSGITVMPNDQIVMVGGTSYFSAARFLPDGTLDTTFGSAGKVTIPFDNFRASATCVLVQPDGKTVIAGRIYTVGGPEYFGIVRLLSNGSLDTSFNGTGKLQFDFEESYNYLKAIDLQADGKIVVAGQSGQSAAADFAVARINPDGTFDSGFGIGGKKKINIQIDDRGRCLKIQPDGKIIIGGYSYPAVSGSPCWFTAVRLTNSGELDVTFNTDGIALAKIGIGNDTVFDMALQSDGKILLAAESYIPNSQDFGVVRFTTNGDLDTTFSGDGKFSTSMINTTDYCNAIEVQSDGKILLAGSFQTTPERNMAIIRLTTNGELDTGFSGDGKANYVVPGNNGVSVHDMKLQSTGQILVSGYASFDYMLARIHNSYELSIADWSPKTASFYPNPAKDVILFNDNVILAALYTLDGKKITEQSITERTMNISDLVKGTYLIHIQTADGKIHNQKIVVE